MHFKAENLRIPKHSRLLFLAQNLGVLQPFKTRCHFLWDTLYMSVTTTQSLWWSKLTQSSLNKYSYNSNQIFMFLPLIRWKSYYFVIHDLTNAIHCIWFWIVFIGVFDLCTGYLQIETLLYNYQRQWKTSSFLSLLLLFFGVMEWFLVQNQWSFFFWAGNIFHQRIFHL